MLTVAMEVLDDDQEPPDAVSDSVVLLPWHRDEAPEIDGILFTKVIFLILLFATSEKYKFP